MSLAVHMQGISKRFGPVIALEDVDLHVEPNTIHAVVGENGAGKTTLMRALYAAAPADAGTIWLNGEAVHFAVTKDAIRAGIGMVSQHYAIIPELTCLQNLMLGAEGSTLLNLQASRKKAEALASRMGFEFDWSGPASELSPAGAQKLEILKLLWREAKIMILDEPTAMLSPADSDALFASLRVLASEGATVILVTHRLREVIDHCQTVTVLRGGKLVAEKPVAETSASELAHLIVGSEMDGGVPVFTSQVGGPVLEIEGLSVTGERGNVALDGISLTAHSGEILGIAGVDGNGQRELFQAIAGVTPSTGMTEIRGMQASSTAQRLQQGLQIIPEDRHEEGIVAEWSLEDNAALGLQRSAVLKSRGRRRWATEVAGLFGTKYANLSQPMSSLSGGNQQRFVAGRALASHPSLLLAFQPGRGLDIHGTQQVYQRIRDECESGACAIVVSFDLDELLEHCDRIVVLNSGKLLEPPKGQERDRTSIGRLMVGAG
ncbi:MAG: ABC transporter ATP-binding protein [Fimbriimonas sp.]